MPSHRRSCARHDKHRRPGLWRRLSLIHEADEGWQFYLLAGFLVFIFLIGGDGRNDSGFAAYVWAGAILVAGAGLTGLTGAQLYAHRWLFGIAIGAVGLVLLQLVPLPPRLFAALGHRDLVLTIDRQAGLGGLWRPMTLAPIRTWQALWSTAPALATLILAAQVNARGHRILLGLIIMLGLLSGFIGLLQILGDPHGPLYWHRNTSNGSAVGFFANRNHQAVFLACLFPMLAAWAGRAHEHQRGNRHRDQARGWQIPGRPVMAMLAGLCLVPLVLITGSRAGLVSGALGLCAVPLILAGRERRAGAASANPMLVQFSRWAAAVGGLAVAGLAAATIWFDRAEAWNRLFGQDVSGDMRLRILPTVHAMIRDYFPWGSGLGSFIPTWQIYEPDALLMPTYMNQAHDDWLEVALTGGLPGLALLALVLALWCVAAVRIMRRGGHMHETLLPRAGLTILCLFALASISDYPLRIPSLSCLLVCAAVWMIRDGNAEGMSETTAAPRNG